MGYSYHYINHRKIKQFGFSPYNAYSKIVFNKHENENNTERDQDGEDEGRRIEKIIVSNNGL